MNDRNHPKVRRSALLLSGLTLSPDAALEGYRNRRAADPELAPEALRRARDILDAVAQAITSGDPDRWARLDMVHKTLAGDAVLDLSEEPEPPAFEAPAPPSRFEAPPADAAPPAAEPSTDDATADAAAAPLPTRPSSPAVPAVVAPEPAVAAPPSTATPAPIAMQPPRQVGGPPGASPWAASGALPSHVAQAAQVQAVVETAPDPLNSTIDATASPVDWSKVVPFKSNPNPAARVSSERQDAHGERANLPVALPFNSAPASTGESEPAPTSTRSHVEQGPASMRAPGPLATQDDAPVIPSLTLEQYAAFSAVVRAKPDQIAHHRAQYQLADQHAHAALNMVWSQRLAADPAQRARYDELVAHYTQWYQSRGG